MFVHWNPIDNKLGSKCKNNIAIIITEANVIKMSDII